MLFQLVSDVLLTKTFFLNGVQLVGYTLAFVVAYKLIFYYHHVSVSPMVETFSYKLFPLRTSSLLCDIDIAILSVCLSVTFRYCIETA